MTSQETIAEALTYSLNSPNELDSNFEPANVVDGLFAIARALDRLSQAMEGRAKGLPDGQVQIG